MGCIPHRANRVPQRGRRRQGVLQLLRRLRCLHMPLLPAAGPGPHLTQLAPQRRVLILQQGHGLRRRWRFHTSGLRDLCLLPSGALHPNRAAAFAAAPHCAARLGHHDSFRGLPQGGPVLSLHGVHDRTQVGQLPLQAGHVLRVHVADRVHPHRLHHLLG